MPCTAKPGIGLITENGVLGLGRSAVVFAPRSFGSTAYEALYGNDFM
jgi:stage II sporulation protein GA (sporulation sigma-E factor processing peptidase)